jgi:hypothetical protein
VCLFGTVRLFHPSLDLPFPPGPQLYFSPPLACPAAVVVVTRSMETVSVVRHFQGKTKPKLPNEKTKQTIRIGAGGDLRIKP